MERGAPWGYAPVMRGLAATAALAALIGCGGEEDRSGEIIRANRAKRAAAAALVDARVPPDAPPPADLPPVAVAPKLLLGRAEKHVTKLLGVRAGKVEGWPDVARYDLGPVLLDVGFSSKKAVWVQALPAGGEVVAVWRDAYAAWLGYDSNDQELALVQDMGVAYYPQVWDKKALARSNARAAAEVKRDMAEIDERRRAQQPLADLVNLSSRAAGADYLAVVVDDYLVITGEPCTSAVLQVIVDGLGEGSMQAAAYFRGLRCQSGGAELGF